jgi:AbrB family looped-hinge helix DNA binding protein
MPKVAHDKLGRRATMTSKGQVTIPKAIREQLGLQTGITLHFWVDPTRRIVVTPLTLGIDDLIGILPKPERPLTIDEINEGIAEAAVERAAS